MFLGEVADLESVAGFDLTGVHRLDPGQQAEQRRLAGTVEAQHHHPGASVDGQIHPGKDLEGAVVSGQSLGDQRRATARGGAREPDLGHLVSHPFGVEGRHHPLRSTQHVLGGNGFSGFCAHLRGLRAQCRRLLLGVGAFPAATLFVGGAGVEVLLPTHVVHVGLAADGVEKPHPVHDIGEEFDVVADDHQSPGVRLEEVPEPADGVGIEVVGRFVEQQGGVRTGAGIAGRKQNSSQFDPATLSAGQRPQRLGQHSFGQTQARTDPPRLAFSRITAEGGEALLEVAVAADGLVLLGRVDHLGHQDLLLLQVGQQGVQASRRQHPVAGQHVKVALSGILRQVADLTVAHHGAGIGLTLPRQDAQGGGLARTVAADQTDAVAGLDPQRRTFSEQQGARAGADLEVRCGDQLRTLLLLVYFSSVKTGDRFSARAATASSKFAVSRRT